MESKLFRVKFVIVCEINKTFNKNIFMEKSLYSLCREPKQAYTSLPGI